MKREDLIQILKASQWAKCKGELKALIELEGSNFPVYEGNKVIPGKWQEMQKMINEFIENFECNGLQE